MLQSLWMAWRLRRTQKPDRLRLPAALISLLVLGQVTLGIGSWAVKYGWPIVFEPWFSQPGFLVQSQSMMQSLIVTGHVALGALILAVSVVVAVKTTRVAFGCVVGVSVGSEYSPTISNFVGANA